MSNRSSRKTPRPRSRVDQRRIAAGVGQRRHMRIVAVVLAAVLGAVLALGIAAFG